MKRLLTLITALVLLTGAAIFVQPSSAAALTKSEKQACYEKYNKDTGVRVARSSDAHNKFLKDKCSKAKGGSCTGSEDKDNPRFIQIKCAKALTKAEATKESCYNKYGKEAGLSLARESTTYKDFLKDKCNKANGGSCTSAVNEENPRLVRITCVGIDGNGGSGGDKADDDGAPVCDADCANQDPAVTAAAECSRSRCDLISRYLNPFIVLLTALVGLAITIGILWGGIQVMTSAGDPQKSASGKNHIRDAVIAAVAYVILFAFLQWLVPGGIM